MPHATLRDLYHVELKILRFVKAHEPTRKHPGCPLMGENGIEHHCKPDPVHEAVEFLRQERVIEEPTAPQGHKYTNMFALTSFGVEILEEYDREKKPRKACARPGIAKTRAEIAAEQGAKVDPSERGAPMLAIGAGTSQVGEAINHLQDAEVGPDGKRGHAKSVRGKGAAGRG